MHLQINGSTWRKHEMCRQWFQELLLMYAGPCRKERTRYHHSRARHVPRLHTADEVVMAVEVPVAANLNEPGATAGTSGHITGDGDHRATTMLPAFTGGTLTGLPGLTIEGIPGGVAIGVERLIDRLIICPTGTTDQLSQETLAIGRNDGHAKVMMIVIWPGVYPVGRDLQIASGPAAIRRTAVLVQWTEDHVLYPVPIP